MANSDSSDVGFNPTPAIGPFEVVDPAAREQWFPPIVTGAPVSNAGDGGKPLAEPSGIPASATPLPAKPIAARPVAARPIAATLVAAQGTTQPAAKPPRKLAAGGQTAERPEGEEGEEDGEDPVDVAARRAPPWLMSSMVHMLLLIIMGLMTAVAPKERPALIELDISGNGIGDESLDSSFEIAAPDMEITPEIAPLAVADVPAIADPLIKLPEAAIPMPQGPGVENGLPGPSIGNALSGRDADRKKLLLGKYGGTDETEKAVQRALAWLKRNQRPDGSWSLVGPYQDGGISENAVAATSMAILAYQGAGHTHKSGEYQPVVEKAWRYLLRMQNSQGLFTNDVIPAPHYFYTHGQATIAVCEAYGMTHDPRFRPAAERAVQYCVQTQAPPGGWRYAPKTDSDTSVTGWILMGLQSAKMGGIEVPQDTFDNISRFLDSVAREGGGRYVYQAQDTAIRDATMTAEALLCRQYLGWKRTDKRMLDGVKYILENPIDKDHRDVYYWYYATQVCHHMEGQPWERWNAVMRKAVPEMQTKSGAESGSWDPQNDFWGSQNAGRLYTTCLSTFMLEVYYRHLPIYSKVFATEGEKE
jgi:hypothetical protein